MRELRTSEHNVRLDGALRLGAQMRGATPPRRTWHGKEGECAHRNASRLLVEVGSSDKSPRKRRAPAHTSQHISNLEPRRGRPPVQCLHICTVDLQARPGDPDQSSARPRGSGAGSGALDSVGIIINPVRQGPNCPRQLGEDRRAPEPQP